MAAAAGSSISAVVSRRAGSSGSLTDRLAIIATTAANSSTVTG